MPRRKQSEKKYDDRFNIRTYKTFKDQVREAAEKEGLSVSGFITNVLHMALDVEIKKATAKKKAKVVH